jgi:uncharacterized protein YjbI with pentapeptide repeats
MNMFSTTRATITKTSSSFSSAASLIKSSSSNAQKRQQRRLRRRLKLEAKTNNAEEEEEENGQRMNTTTTNEIRAAIKISKASFALALAIALQTPSDAFAEQRLPPIDSDPNRCERAFVGNTIGQANAVSDKQLDLRECKYDKVSVKGITLSGALMVDAVFDNSDFSEAVMSKVYAPKASFKNVNFTNAVIDRATFDGSDFTNANFQNAVLTGVSYTDGDFTGANFEEALIGDQDVKNLCLNPTVVDLSRMQIGCKN